MLIALKINNVESIVRIKGPKEVIRVNDWHVKPSRNVLPRTRIAVTEMSEEQIFQYLKNEEHNRTAKVGEPVGDYPYRIYFEVL